MTMTARALRTLEEPRLFRPTEDAILLDPSAMSKLWSPWGDDEDDDCKPYEIQEGVAIIPIEGPLMQRGGWWWDGYEAIKKKCFAALEDAEVQSVLLKINSPGGMAAGCFEAVKSIREQIRLSGKPVVAYVDEQATSAAYALASVADQIVCPPSGSVGSVGVIVTVGDYTGYNKLNGIKVSVLTYGDQKADGHPDVKFTDEIKARIQARVDELGLQFSQIVAQARGLTVDQVIGLQAGVFLAAAALQAKLIDSIGGLDDALMAARTRGAVAKAKKDTQMSLEQIAAALQLDPKTAEADVAEAVTSLASREASVSAVVQQFTSICGATDPQTALGIIQGWRASHEQLSVERENAAKAQASLEKIKKEEAQKARVARVESAVSEGILAPVQKDFALSLDDAQLDGFLTTLPKSPAVKSRTEAHTEATGNGAESLSEIDQRVAKAIGISPAQMAAIPRSEKKVSQ